MKPIIMLFALVSCMTIKAQDNLTQQTTKGILAHNYEQIMGLANAFSEEQYDWRPAEGIRSVGEALLHIASTQYYIGSKLGYAYPEDVDVMTLESITGKDNIIEAVENSNAYMMDILDKEGTDTLSDEVDLGFMKLSRLGSLLVILEHSGEHKGQLIAYARSIGVVPPWSK